jgi:hypothetical protein
MAKQVTVQSGKTFTTLKAAKQHFGGIRNVTNPGTPLADPDRSDILDLYRRYCAATNYPAVAAVGVTTVWDNRQRPAGNYAQTKAFAVVDDVGNTSMFSIDKALETVAV